MELNGYLLLARRSLLDIIIVKKLGKAGSYSTIAQRSLVKLRVNPKELVNLYREGSAELILNYIIISVQFSVYLSLVQRSLEGWLCLAIYHYRIARKYVI